MAGTVVSAIDTSLSTLIRGVRDTARHDDELRPHFGENWFAMASPSLLPAGIPFPFGGVSDAGIGNFLWQKMTSPRYIDEVTVRLWIFVQAYEDYEAIMLGGAPDNPGVLELTMLVFRRMTDNLLKGGFYTGPAIASARPTYVSASEVFRMDNDEPAIRQALEIKYIREVW